MPQMYCSHVTYCTTLRCNNSHHHSSPQEILAVRGGAINLILDVPTFTTSRLPRDPNSQRWNYVDEKWLMNFAWNARLPRILRCYTATTGSYWCFEINYWFYLQGQAVQGMSVTYYQCCTTSQKNEDLNCTYYYSTIREDTETIHTPKFQMWRHTKTEQV